jgi:hypothetical protein
MRIWNEEFGYTGKPPSNEGEGAFLLVMVIVCGLIAWLVLA